MNILFLYSSNKVHSTKTMQYVLNYKSNFLLLHLVQKLLSKAQLGHFCFRFQQLYSLKVGEQSKTRHLSYFSTNSHTNILLDDTH